MKSRNMSQVKFVQDYEFWRKNQNFRSNKPAVFHVCCLNQLSL